MHAITPQRTFHRAFDAGSAGRSVTDIRSHLDDTCSVLPRLMLLVVMGHEFHETCHSVTFYFVKKDSKRCCNTTVPESIHTKDESKRSSAFAFIFGVN